MQAGGRIFVGEDQVGVGVGYRFSPGRSPVSFRDLDRGPRRINLNYKLGQYLTKPVGGYAPTQGKTGPGGSYVP